MALSWSARRQFLYYAVAAVVAFVLITTGWQIFFTNAPTCFDGVQNGIETGIDCGGACSLVCADVARDPVVVWRQAFNTSPNTYTAAAYLRNNNQNSGAKNVPYSFRLFDAQNVLVIQKDGVANLPPTQIIPIIEPNINVGNRSVARVDFTFGAKPIWEKVSPESLATLKASTPVPNEDYSRVSTTITNDSTLEARNTTVTVVVFDQEGTARAASKSILSRIAPKSSQPVVFTWQSGVEGAVRAEIRILQSF